MLKWRNKFDKFIDSEFYLAIVSFLVLIGWQFSGKFSEYIENDTFHFSVILLSIILIIYTLIFIYTIISNKGCKPVLPLLINLLFSSKIYYNANIIPWFQIILSAIGFIGLMAVFIRNGELKNGKLGLGFFLLALASYFSGINIPLDINPMLYITIFSYSGYYLLYLFIINTTKSDDKTYFAKILFYLSILLICQTFIIYIEDSYFKTLAGFRLFYGWGISNDGAIILGCILPFTCYLITKNKLLFYRIAVLFLSALAMLLTLSRGGIALLAIVGLACVIVLIAKKAINQRVILYCTFWLALSVLFIAINQEFYHETLEHLGKDGISLTGRPELYRDAFKIFSKNPFFGSSVLGVKDWENRFIVYHSLFFNTLAVYGMLGIVAMTIHLLEKYWFLVKNMNLYAVFLLIFMLSTDLYGMLDNTYGNLHYTFILVSSLAVFEKSMVFELSPQDKTSIRLNKKESGIITIA